MEYSPPPLFKQGPSALARLIFFVLLALALLISDARFKTLEIVRGVLGAGLYPLQRAALVPRDIFMGAADLAVTSATCAARMTHCARRTCSSRCRPIRRPNWAPRTPICARCCNSRNA